MIRSLWFSAGLTVLFVTVVWYRASAVSLVIAVPFFFCLYAALFSMGDEKWVSRLRRWTGADYFRIVTLPLALSLVYFFYTGLGRQNPFQGNTWLIPILFSLPALYYARFAPRDRVTWHDLVALILCIAPHLIRKLPVNSNLPYEGGGFDSLYQVSYLIAIIYAVLVVRRLQFVGFTFKCRWQDLKVAIGTGLFVFAIAFALGWPTGLFEYVGFDDIKRKGWILTIGFVVKEFLHTALPEELLFRGMMQNLLTQWLEQTGLRHALLVTGFIAMFGFAVFFGFKGYGMLAWLPACLVAALFLWVFYRLRKTRGQADAYSALALMSVLFGLVHFTNNSPVFVSLAMIAGWAYGYVYIKTRSVIYAALTHTLVNSTSLFLGLQLAK